VSGRQIDGEAEGIKVSGVVQWRPFSSRTMRTRRAQGEPGVSSSTRSWFMLSPPCTVGRDRRADRKTDRRCARVPRRRVPHAGAHRGRAGSGACGAGSRGQSRARRLARARRPRARRPRSGCRQRVVRGASSEASHAHGELDALAGQRRQVAYCVAAQQEPRTRHLQHPVSDWCHRPRLGDARLGGEALRQPGIVAARHDLDELDRAQAL